MNLRGIIATIIAMLFATMASAQSPNNAVWGVNDQNEVFRWNPSQNKFEPMPGILKQVSVGNDGEVWGIDPADDVFRWTGSDWQQLQGAKLKQLSVRNAQEVWGVNDANALFRWTGSAWEPIVEDGHPVLPVVFVSAGADGTVWGIGPEEGVIITISAWLESHTLFAMQKPGSGHLKRISVTDGNRAWAIDDNAQLFQWTEPNWQHFDGNYIDVAEAANGELWRLASDGTILFNQDPSARTQSMDSGRHLKQIAVGSAGAMVPGLTVDQQQILDTHNRERQNYPGVGALQWSPGLEEWAQEWAQIVASRNRMFHRDNQRSNPFKPGEAVGENIYGWGPSRGVTGADAAQSWINEKQWYHYDQDNGKGAFGEPPGCTAGKVCGHFTQVIWKNTQYVGCGKAISANDTIYYVCNYYPAGNNGQKPY